MLSEKPRGEALQVAKDALLGLLLGVVVAVFADEFSSGTGRLVAPILGVSAALVVAFVAYPWQKLQDRRLEFHREKRQFYRDFFSSWSDVEAKLIAITKDNGLAPEEKITELLIVVRLADKLLMDLALLADKTILDAAIGLHDRIYHRIAEVRDEFGDLLEATAKGQVPIADIDRIFVDKLIGKDEIYLRLQDDLVNQIRREFGVRGQIESYRP